MSRQNVCGYCTCGTMIRHIHHCILQSSTARNTSNSSLNLYELDRDAALSLMLQIHQVLQDFDNGQSFKLSINHLRVCRSDATLATLCFPFWSTIMIIRDIHDQRRGVHFFPKWGMQLELCGRLTLTTILSNVTYFISTHL